MKEKNKKIKQDKPEFIITAFFFSIVVAVLYSAPSLYEKLQNAESSSLQVSKRFLLPFADGFSLISKAAGFSHLRTQMDRAVSTINNLEPIGAKNSIVYKHEYAHEFIKKG